MSKLVLMGARKFLDMPKGTYFIPISLKTEDECRKTIEQFKENPKSLLDFSQLHIWCDNLSSMSFNFYEADEDDADDADAYIFYYDFNVVGDATPKTDLYLVLDESIIPDIIHDSGGAQITHEQVVKTHEIFVRDYASESSEYAEKDLIEAKEFLDTLKQREIIDLCLEYTE